jgi:phosphatidyl-myo-inositol alpha-mannosyltransferase
VTRSLKIALIPAYDYPYPGGVTQHITALARGLRERGHQVRIVAACSEALGKVPAGVIKVSNFISPVPVADSVARLALSPRLIPRVKAVLQRERFDILHLHEPMAPALPWIVLRHSAAYSPAAVIGTFHGYRDTLVRSWHYVRPLVQGLFDRLDTHIAVSPAARDYIQSYFPAPYQVIPNGVDLTRFKWLEKESHNARQKSQNILFVGRLEKRKGFCYLLEAFRQVRRCLPNVTLTIVGTYDAAQIAPFFSEPGVKFVGYSPDEELPQYYQQADVFCAPSTGFESFGVVLLEAMATGVPIIASDIVGYRTVMTDGREGFLVPPQDVSSLASALLGLLTNPYLRAQMGLRGREKASYYSWDLIVDRVLGVYHQSIEQKFGARFLERPGKYPGA